MNDEQKHLQKVSENGLLLQSIPDEQITKRIALAAVENNGMALAFVPEKHKTLKICLAAIKNDYLAIHCVPKRLRDKKFEEIWHKIQIEGLLPSHLTESGEICQQEN